MKRTLDRLFNGPWLLTFMMLGVFGGLFGLTSADLAMLLHANLGYILREGAMGVIEGGAEQFVRLVATSYLSLIFYVLFKGCLYGLLGRFQRH